MDAYGTPYFDDEDNDTDTSNADAIRELVYDLPARPGTRR